MYVWNAVVIAAAVAALIFIPFALILIFFAYPYAMPFALAFIIIFTILWKREKRKKLAAAARH